MNLVDLRRRADAVRDTPLETVLTCHHASRDKHDRSKWHTEQGTLSISGPKFMNWQRSQGGGGAIDLVMHLYNVDFRSAVAWLEQHVAVSCVSAATPSSSQHSDRARSGQLQLPVPNKHMLDRVRRYLTQRRRLAPSLLQPLIESGRLYADNRGNAVFLLVTGKPNRPIGAELRGRVLAFGEAWRLAAGKTAATSGSAKQRLSGSFSASPQSTPSVATNCIPIESASPLPASARIHPGSPNFSPEAIRFCCGFDADQPGDAAATAMAAIYPDVQRLRPPVHDWNDVLASAK